jgi:hypothetical protein
VDLISDLSRSVELAGRLAIDAPIAGRPLVIGPAATRRQGLAASGCGGALAEVFVTEVLTCLAAALQVHAAERVEDAAVAAVTLQVFERHQQLRHEAMVLMLDRADAETAEVAAADRLRRRAERWTDVLLGCCPAGLDLEQFAHDPARAEDFRVEQDPITGVPRRSLRRSLLLTSLRQAFPPDLAGVPDHAPLHRAIHAALASALPDAAPHDDVAVSETPPPAIEPDRNPGPPERTAEPSADGIRFSHLYRRPRD